MSMLQNDRKHVSLSDAQISKLLHTGGEHLRELIQAATGRAAEPAMNPAAALNAAMRGITESFAQPLDGSIKLCAAAYIRSVIDFKPGLLSENSNLASTLWDFLCAQSGNRQLDGSIRSSLQESAISLRTITQNGSQLNGVSFGD